MDLAGGDVTKGNLQIWDCNNLGNQQWWYDQSSLSIKYRDDQSKCIEISQGNLTNGNALRLGSCAGTANQQWYGSGLNQWYSKAGTKCMNLRGGNIANGNKITIWDCAS